MRTYRISMDIGRTQSGQVGGDMGEWWVEEARLRPFTACAVDAPPPPPPDDWVWPQEGDRIEVEVRRPLARPSLSTTAPELACRPLPRLPHTRGSPAADPLTSLAAPCLDQLDDGEYGIVWCPAVITAVLVDSWLHAKITNPRYGEGEAAEWEDWFSWVEEGTDWRREGAGDDDDDDDDTDEDDSDDDDDADDEEEEKTYPKVRLVFKSRDAAGNGAEAASKVGSRYSIPKVKSLPPNSQDAPAASAGAESSASAAGLAGAAAAQYYEETRDGSTTFSWREYERATMETDAAALGTRRGTKLRSLSPVAAEAAGGAERAPKAEAEAGAGAEAQAGAGAEAEAEGADGAERPAAEAEGQAVDAGESGGPSQED